MSKTSAANIDTITVKHTGVKSTVPTIISNSMSRQVRLSEF